MDFMTNLTPDNFDDAENDFLAHKSNRKNFYYWTFFISNKYETRNDGIHTKKETVINEMYLLSLVNRE